MHWDGAASAQQGTVPPMTRNSTHHSTAQHSAAQHRAGDLHELNKLNLCALLTWTFAMSPAGTSRPARFSRDRLLAPPNLLRRAAVADTVGVGRPVLKPVPLVELAEEAEGATEGVVLPTCSAS